MANDVNIYLKKVAQDKPKTEGPGKGLAKVVGGTVAGGAVGAVAGSATGFTHGMLGGAHALAKKYGNPENAPRRVIKSVANSVVSRAGRYSNAGLIAGAGVGAYMGMKHHTNKVKEQAMGKQANIYLQKLAMKHTTKDTLGMYGRGAIGNLAGSAAGALTGAAATKGHPLGLAVGNAVGGIAGNVAGYGSKVREIARQHGKTISKGEGLKEGTKTLGRSVGRSVVEAVGGGLAGAGVGAVAGLAAKNPQLGATVGSTIGAVGGAVHGGFKSLNNSVKKYHDKYASEDKIQILEKLSGVAGLGASILGAAKNTGRAIMNDAKALPGQVRNTGTAFKANGGGKAGLTNPGTVASAKAVLKNKAVLTGAGVVGAGVAANSMRNKSD